MLEAIAESWSIPLTDEQVPEIVGRLVVEMTDAEAIALVLKRLSDVEREALAFASATGQAKAHVMVRKYGRIRRLGPGRLEWEHAWREPASAMERLWFLGLLHRGYGMDETHHGEVFFIPPEILDALPKMSAPLPVFRIEPATRPPIMRDDHDALAHDAFVILSYLRNNAVRARKGVLAAHELPRLRPRLADPQDLQCLSFLHHVCERACLIRREEGLWNPTSEAASWLKDGALARRRTFYRTWLEDSNWNELCMMPDVRCEATGWHNDQILARTGVVNHLLKCPVDAWLTIPSFVESVHEVDADFMRPDGDYDSWYIRDARTGHYLMGYSNWEKVEGALIRYLLEYPLLWLGVVAVGYPKGQERACCFMLTNQGAATLGLREVSEGPLRPIVVQPNLQVSVPREGSWYDRFLLERFAHWRDEQDGLARYVINADSVRACLESGVTVKQICAFLRRATGDRVPDPVLRALKSWARGNTACCTNR